jgi:hypothetical protein
MTIAVVIAGVVCVHFQLTGGQASKLSSTGGGRGEWGKFLGSSET